MELSENERLMLVGKKDEIRKLTVEIFDLMNTPQQALEIKKKITSIQSLISSIASYSNSKNINLNKLTEFELTLFALIRNLEIKDKVRYTHSGYWKNRIYPRLWIYEVVPNIERYCNYVNSIRFDFTRKDFKIILPKIDFSIFKT
jgi:hypothetical protein